MKTIIIDECYIGTQFPCALEYGDLTGLEEEEEQDLNNWLAFQTIKADKHTKFPALTFEYGDESEFETCEITRLRGNCVACKVFILVDGSPCEVKAMTEPQIQALRELRNAGYAVCTLDPVGLCGADPGHIEDLMLKKALIAIEAFQERTEP